MQVNLVNVNGAVKISIDGKIIEPLSFKSFRPTERNISDFYNAGVRVFSILSSGLPSALKVQYSTFGESWTGENSYDFSVIDEQIDLFIKCAPEGYFALMLQVDTRSWWHEKYPDFPESFQYLSQSLCCDEWKTAAGNYLKAAVSHVEEKYGERFYGYFILGGMTTEWMSGCDFEEASPRKRKKYKEYMHDENAEIPTPREREQDSETAFVKEDNLASYRQFHNELIADGILYFAKKVREVVGRRKLIGVYFGYLMELYDNLLWNRGHIAFEKVYSSEDIDIISSPSSYVARGVESMSAMMVTDKTLQIHNKLYYLEFDHITHIAPQSVDGCNIPGHASKYLCEQDTIDVMRRDYMLCLSKGAALWWFDMFEGWFYSKPMMECVANMVAFSKKFTEKGFENNAEILAVASPDSLYRVNKNAAVNTDVFENMKKELGMTGAPYDCISEMDLDLVNAEQYKLVIFLDLFKVSDKTKEVIENKFKKNGKTIMWLYAPGYIREDEEEKFSEKYISELCGIEVCRTENEEKEIVFGENIHCGGVGAATPGFEVCDKEAKQLAVYAKSGKVAAALKQFAGYTSVYFARGGITAEVIRSIAYTAGVHLYTDKPAATYINSSMIGVYSAEDIMVNTLSDAVYKDVFTGIEYKAENGKMLVSKGTSRAKLLVKNNF